MARRNTRGSLYILVLLSSATLLASAEVQPAVWAQSEGKVSKFLKKKQSAVARLMKKGGGTADAKKAHNNKITSMISELLDYKTLSKMALHKHWDKQSPKQRQEFVSLLKELVERNYRQNLKNTLDYDISYLEESGTKKGVLVKTSARSKKNRRQPAVLIDYELHKVGSRWMVFNIVTDGVSLVDNYRQQFDRIIKKEKWSGLIKRMRKRAQKSS